MMHRELPIVRWLGRWRADWREELSAYLDGELSPRERSRVEARLAASDEMRAYLANLQAMQSMIRQVAPPLSHRPFQLTPELIAAAESAERVSARQTEFGKRLTPSYVAVSAVATIAFAAFVSLAVFDVVHPPSVEFSQTNANQINLGPADVPTATVTTDTVEVAAESQPEPQATVSSRDSVEAQESATEQAQPEAVEELATELVAQQEQAALAASDQEDQELAAVATSDEPAGSTSDAEQVREDSSRRALTSGSGGGSTTQSAAVANRDRDAISDTSSAADGAGAVADDQIASASDAAESRAAEPAADAETSEAIDTQRATDEADRPESQSAPTASTQPPTVTVQRTVATSTSVTQWPLQQRARERPLPAAADPSWEWPLQVALGVLTLVSAVAWLMLHFWSRRTT